MPHHTATKSQSMEIPSSCTAVLRSQLGGRDEWLSFHHPLRIIQTTDMAQVAACLLAVEAELAAGHYAVGYVSYEAAQGLDAAFKIRQPSERLPLVWFAIHHAPETFIFPLGSAQQFTLQGWVPNISEANYRTAIDVIKKHIQMGDTYQVNYSLRLHSNFSGSAWDLFVHLQHAQQAKYSAFLQLDGWSICSASPELFFRCEDQQLICKPMKGTVQRGLTLQQDAQYAAWLQASEKNRAENIMIVDMIRNDVGKISEIGSVRATQLFAIEKYPTVWQMTSTVTATPQVSAVEVLRKMFPCASITGAPKVKTMEIIRQLETAPRGVYTGAIGYFAPDGAAQFNVAIRTVVIEQATGIAEYGVGSGVVWDSEPADEYAECQTKANLLIQSSAEFSLFETLLWQPDSGLYLLELHLERLLASAEYFEFKCQREAILMKLDALSLSHPDAPRRVKILLKRDGGCVLEVAEIQPIIGRTVGIAAVAQTKPTKFMCHKTTVRDAYQQALAQTRQALDSDLCDVLLWDAQGWLTESTIANIVLSIGGAWYTPPTAQGLLPGVFRRMLLDHGAIAERPIHRDELREAEQLYLINSLRGWMRLVPTPHPDIWRIASEFVLHHMPN